MIDTYIVVRLRNPDAWVHDELPRYKLLVVPDESRVKY